MALRRSLLCLLRAQLNSSGQQQQQRRAQSVAVVGAPFSKGQKRRGVEHGPKFIRDAGLLERLSLLDCPVHDLGDLKFHHPEKDDTFMQVHNPRTVGRANQLLASTVSSAVGAGHTCVMLGGDHSLAIGSVEGHSRQCPDLGLIWVDAHTDVNTPLTSPSGNLHGQSVAFMLKELQDKIPDLPGFSWMKPFLSSRDLVYIGLRDTLGIQYFSMRDIDRLGIQRGIYITEEIHNTGLLSAMDLVEVNPILGASRAAMEATASLAVDVIASSLGQTREGSHVRVDEIPSVGGEDTEQLRL
ncbi:hypothetical protein CRUP_004584 [Coryphaenoides rupestris]|nr:hypothetical protein CRUP_004584 [Coryphaenoides rupestris]